MFYYLYEIRNNLNGKIYVGVHKTSNMNDGYMGSGKVICSAISKHGVNNFTKTVLEEFNTAEEMYAREAEIVTEEFLLRDDVYNLRRGGSGGFDYINKMGLGVPFITSENAFELSSKGNISKELKYSDYELRMEYNERVSNGLKSSYEKGLESGFKNKKHSAESLNRIREGLKGKQQGEKNSQFGTFWITDEVVSKKINKGSTIPEGWRPGRKQKG